MGTVPIVDYLVLNDRPYLVSNRCENCGALFFGRRNACARCGQQSFREARLNDGGTLRAFTIVHRAWPGISTPFVSAIVDIDGGGTVNANLVNIDPDPDVIKLGMPLRLTTFTAATDEAGNEAVAFGYEPA